jgi:hypothetical protein
MKHTLKWVNERGKLADALGISHAEAEASGIELLVEKALARHWSMQELFEAVGDLDISDELWANFLYTYGWWDGRRSP